MPRSSVPRLSAYSRFSPAVAAASILCFFLLTLSAAVPSAVAQSPAASTPPATRPADTQTAGDESQETVKVNVNVVGLFFNVKDKHGALIPNLTKNDFEVLEDGKPQTIKYFAAESNLPLTLGMLIDSSGSQRAVLDMEKEVGGAFLKQILTDKDEAYVMDFNIDAELIQDYTRDVHRLQAALNKVKINTGFVNPVPGAGNPLPSAGGGAGTVLYDAVYCRPMRCWPKKSGARR